MIGVDAGDDEFVATACAAMAGADAAGALEGLGWWDLIDGLDDPDVRRAAFSVFRAQGRTLVSSPALCGLVARPLVAGTRLDGTASVAALRRTTRRRGTVWTVVGDTGDRTIVIAEPERGAFAVEPEEAQLLDVDIPGRANVREVVADLHRREPFIDGSALGGRLASAVRLGRIAAATEMLGAAEAAVSLAAAHAVDRHQFGQPVAAFQAVRHLLAWATADCVAIAAMTHSALVAWDDPPERFDVAVKALAGRNARRACEHSLQVLGGIGFTAEHDHHHHHSRVLVLDAVLGSSGALYRELGRWVRARGAMPTWSDDLLIGRR